MFLVDLLGAGLTLLTLLFLFLSGYLLARMLLGRRAGEDPLAFVIAALLLTTAEAVLLGLFLGALGLLDRPRPGASDRDHPGAAPSGAAHGRGPR